MTAALRSLKFLNLTLRLFHKKQVFMNILRLKPDTDNLSIIKFLAKRR